MPMPAAVHRSEYHGYLEFHEAYSRLGAHFEELPFSLSLRSAVSTDLDDTCDGRWPSLWQGVRTQKRRQGPAGRKRIVIALSPSPRGIRFGCRQLDSPNRTV